MRDHRPHSRGRLARRLTARQYRCGSPLEHKGRVMGTIPQMADSIAGRTSAPAAPATTLRPRHSALVRVTHWLTTISFLALLVTGVEILLSHPRFYWGETGNVNTAPLFKLPLPSSRAMVPTG